MKQQDGEPHGSADHARLCADDARWITLTLVGIQEDDLRGPADILELRNCTCGSTLGRRTRREL